MSKKGVVHGLKLEINNTQKPCTDCFQGKMHVQAFPTGRTRGKNLGALIHSDVNGPMEKMLPGQARYFVIFKDNFSGWCLVHFIRNKSFFNPQSRICSEDLLPVSRPNTMQSSKFFDSTIEELAALAKH